MSRLEDPFEIGSLSIKNRLYRAPLLECAGTGDDAVNTLIRELEPAAEAGVGLILQGATIVRPTGGCAAPNMTRVADPDFVTRLSRLTDRIHAHGARIFIQLEHGGLRSRETWHHEYRDEAGFQLAVSQPPFFLRTLDSLGLIDLNPHVLDTDEVYELAADFGRSAEWSIEAGYDGIHLAGANMGIIQQFLSPYYNRRDDEFEDGVRFLTAIHDEIRGRVGSVPLITKVPIETPAPPFIRPRLSQDAGITISRRLERIGFDGVVPVQTSTFWDASIIRGEYPSRSWTHPSFQNDYAAVFGGHLQSKLISLGNRIQSLFYTYEPGWNEGFCVRVADSVSIPVLMEGGIRNRRQIDRLLKAGVCDAVGLGRPFYAEPKLPARLLNDGDAVICESCNNCVIPQIAGETGVCRTPDVLRKRGALEKAGAYKS